MAKQADDGRTWEERWQSTMRKLNRIVTAESNQPALMTHEYKFDRACRAAATERLFAVVSDDPDSVRNVFAAMAIYNQYYSQANSRGDCSNDTQMTAFLAL